MFRADLVIGLPNFNVTAQVWWYGAAGWLVSMERRGCIWKRDIEFDVKDGNKRAGCHGPNNIG